MKKKINFVIYLFISFLFGVLFTYMLSEWKSKHDINNFSRAELEMYEEYKVPNNVPKCNEKENIYNGSKKYYDELRKYYLSIGFYKFFPWALFMANKFDNSQAYFDVYYSLCELNCLGENKKNNDLLLDNLDAKTQKMAIDYLIKAAEKDHNQAKEILGKYYLEGRYVEKNIALGNKLIKETK